MNIFVDCTQTLGCQVKQGIPRVVRSLVRHGRRAARGHGAELVPVRFEGAASASWPSIPATNCRPALRCPPRGGARWGGGSARRSCHAGFAPPPDRHVVVRQDLLDVFARAQGPLFLTVGTIEPRKNQAVLLGAIDRLLAVVPATIARTSGPHDPPTANSDEGLPNPIGQGIPTISGSWPLLPSMGVEPVTGGTGATGYHGANLTLSETAKVTFQFSGKGDANFYNTFQVLVSGNWTELFTSRTAGPPFTPAFTFVMGPGTLPFRFTTTGVNDNAPNPPLPPATIITNGANTIDITQAASIFLGVDPYTTALQYATTGTAVYAGFSDRAEAVIGDHDHQDLVVRIEAAIVPEPNAAMPAAAGCGAWLAARLVRRRARRPR